MVHPLVTLQRHSECTACSLSVNSKNPGLATMGIRVSGKPLCVLILGKAPAYHEDEAGRPMVPREGTGAWFTEKLYVDATSMAEYADVYVQNTVRCRLVNVTGTVPSKSVTACRAHLEEDLRALSEHYEEIIVLATGADAVKAITRGALDYTSFDQGSQVEFGTVTVRVFATDLGAVLQSKNNPARVNVIRDHLALLLDYLSNRELTQMLGAVEVDRTTQLPVTPDDDLVFLDIETYGAVADLPDQTQFHPAKMVRWDGIDPCQIVQTVSVAWLQQGILRHRELVVTELADQTYFIDWLKYLSPKVAIGGQNLQFDILSLRAWVKALQGCEVLEPWSRPLVELMTLNYLDNDLRQERGLKTVAKLLGVTSYSDEKSLATHRYPSSDDPQLLSYNAKDSCATLLCHRVLRDRIRRWCGVDSPKISERSGRWFSDILWLCILMSETGVVHDTEKLGELRRTLKAELEEIECQCNSQNLVLSGKGSQKWRQDFVLQAVMEFDLGTDRRLIRTPAKVISTCADNINLLLTRVPDRHPTRSVLELWKRQGTLKKLLTSYVEPLLGNSKKVKGSLVGSTAYPTWSCVPLREGSTSSGTVTGRLSATNPGVATYPEPIEATEKSGFEGGHLVSVDGSQIELRVVGDLSGDPKIAEDYVGGLNRHLETAKLVASVVGLDPATISKKGTPGWYAAGKTLNFLVVYKGGASKFSETMMRDHGVAIPVQTSDSIIKAYYAKHRRLGEWQSEQIDEAITRGYIEIPLLGYSRSFFGSPQTVRETYIPDICNTRVQGTAALLVADAILQSMKEFRRKGLRTLIRKDTYDEGVFDVPHDELQVVLPTIVGYFRNPPLRGEWIECGYLHGQVPLDCGVKVDGVEWAEDASGTWGPVAG